jgi:hypothetical protein
MDALVRISTERDHNLTATSRSSWGHPVTRRGPTDIDAKLQALGRPDVLDPQVVLALQRLAGNAAVGELLGSRLNVQRCGDHACQCPPGAQHDELPPVQRKVGVVTAAGCAAEIGVSVGIYGSRATPALASAWERDINDEWKGQAACPRGSVGTYGASVHSKVTAHPDINWWWKVPEANSAYVREAGYDSYTNRLNDSGDWQADADPQTVAHETGHLMGQPDHYWARMPFMHQRSESDYVNDIMANYYQDPGPPVFGRALTEILADQGFSSPCCLKYPPCSKNNCALNPGLPCALVGERRHCEWIRANNKPDALRPYSTDCSTLTR